MPKAVLITFLVLVRLRFLRELSTIKVLQKGYGNVIVKKVREFEKPGFEFRKVLIDINFSDTCPKSNIIPKFVQFRFSNKVLGNSTTYRQCEIKLVKQQTFNKKAKIEKSKKRFNIGEKRPIFKTDFH